MQLFRPRPTVVGQSLCDLCRLRMCFHQRFCRSNRPYLAFSDNVFEHNASVVQCYIPFSPSPCLPDAVVYDCGNTIQQQFPVCQRISLASRPIALFDELVGVLPAALLGNPLRSHAEFVPGKPLSAPRADALHFGVGSRARQLRADSGLGRTGQSFMACPGGREGEGGGAHRSRSARG